MTNSPRHEGGKNQRVSAPGGANVEDNGQASRLGDNFHKSFARRKPCRSAASHRSVKGRVLRRLQTKRGTGRPSWLVYNERDSDESLKKLVDHRQAANSKLSHSATVAHRE